MALIKLLTLLAWYNTEPTYKKEASHEPSMYIGLTAKKAAQ